MDLSVKNYSISPYFKANDAHQKMKNEPLSFTPPNPHSDLSHNVKTAYGLYKEYNSLYTDSKVPPTDDPVSGSGNGHRLNIAA